MCEKVKDVDVFGWKWCKDLGREGDRTIEDVWMAWKGCSTQVTLTRTTDTLPT